MSTTSDKTGSLHFSLFLLYVFFLVSLNRIFLVMEIAESFSAFLTHLLGSDVSYFLCYFNYSSEEFLSH